MDVKIKAKKIWQVAQILGKADFKTRPIPQRHFIIIKTATLWGNKKWQ